MTPTSRSSRAAMFLLIVAVVAVSGSSAYAANTVLKFEMRRQLFAEGIDETYAIGEFYVRLLDNDAPLNTQNFLNYVTDGDYDGSFLHRLIPGFVLQGGSFGFDSASGNAYGVPLDAPIVNEFASSGRSNVRGTLAMAQGPAGADSATSGFFVNLVDNIAGNPNNLDALNGGFTVFAYVIGDGMDLVDQLSGVSPNPLNVGAYSLGGEPFNTVPLIVDGGGSGWFEMISSVSVHGVDGDVDFDGDVDMDDYNAFMPSLGLEGVGLAGDFDGDEDVDSEDLAILQTALPEPATLSLLALGGLAMIRKRRRKS